MDEPRPHRTRWEVVAVNGDGAARNDAERLERLLQEGWEPFAATPNTTGGYRYHLRKQMRGGDDSPTPVRRRVTREVLWQVAITLRDHIPDYCEDWTPVCQRCMGNWPCEDWVHATAILPASEPPEPGERGTDG